MDRIEGIAESGRLLANFLSHAEKGTLESLVPVPGLRSFDAGASEGLPSDSEAYFRALISDLDEVAAPALGDEPEWHEGELGRAEQELTAMCFDLKARCQIMGLNGMLQGLWPGFDCRAGFGCASPFPVALLVPPF